jgi:hypothetical protein
MGPSCRCANVVNHIAVGLEGWVWRRASAAGLASRPGQILGTGTHSYRLRTSKTARSRNRKLAQAAVRRDWSLSACVHQGFSLDVRVIRQRAQPVHDARRPPRPTPAILPPLDRPDNAAQHASTLLDTCNKSAGRAPPIANSIYFWQRMTLYGNTIRGGPHFRGGAMSSWPTSAPAQSETA